jgi:hypothetical protein
MWSLNKADDLLHTQSQIQCGQLREYFGQLLRADATNVGIESELGVYAEGRVESRCNFSNTEAPFDEAAGL